MREAGETVSLTREERTWRSTSNSVQRIGKPSSEDRSEADSQSSWPTRVACCQSAKEGGAPASAVRAGEGAGGLVDEVVADIKSDRPSMKEVGISRRHNGEALGSAIEAMKHAAGSVDSRAPAEAAV